MFYVIMVVFALVLKATFENVLVSLNLSVVSMLATVFIFMLMNLSRLFFLWVRGQKIVQ